MELQQDVNAARLQQFPSQLMKILEEAENDWVKNLRMQRSLSMSLVQSIAKTQGDRDFPHLFHWLLSTMWEYKD